MSTFAQLNYTMSMFIDYCICIYRNNYVSMYIYMYTDVLSSTRKSLICTANFSAAHQLLVGSPQWLDIPKHLMKGRNDP